MRAPQIGARSLPVAGAHCVGWPQLNLMANYLAAASAGPRRPRWPRDSRPQNTHHSHSPLVAHSSASCANSPLGPTGTGRSNAARSFVMVFACLMLSVFATIDAYEATASVVLFYMVSM